MKRELKVQVWELDGGCCRACGTSVPFDPAHPPHHIKYRSQGGKDVPENLITLCVMHDFCVHNGAKVNGVRKPGRWIMWTILNKLKDEPDYRWAEAHKELELCKEVVRTRDRSE